MKISRSYSRKISLGNYEMADFFASRDIELPEDTTIEEQSKASDKLYALCLSDIEKDVENFKKSRETEGQEPDWSEVIKMINSFSTGSPAGVGDFDKLIVGSLKSSAIQAVKRAYNRSPLAKEKLILRSKGTHAEFADTARKHFNAEENDINELIKVGDK